MGSIDDLTIDIADLHRDVKAQKANFIDAASERASEDRKAAQLAHSHNRKGS